MELLGHWHPFVWPPCGCAGHLLAIAVRSVNAQGQRRALDIVSVLQPPGRRYYAFLSIVFGMVANLDRGTEHLRRAWSRQADLVAESCVHGCLKAGGATADFIHYMLAEAVISYVYCVCLDLPACRHFEHMKPKVLG